ncbi:hypothetical protein HaLaN_21388 [Haematococcus lacustris]|uniref:Secreted protein n=1 Tax=Haematococcus lacustris TaxID=44745 RepID=A0A699ZNH7_HAELA|nr:hypothetical protein HaLaN_21388 [Haematococcus lacustris]
MCAVAAMSSAMSSCLLGVYSVCYMLLAGGLSHGRVEGDSGPSVVTSHHISLSRVGGQTSAWQIWQWLLDAVHWLPSAAPQFKSPSWPWPGPPVPQMRCASTTSQGEMSASLDSILEVVELEAVLVAEHYQQALLLSFAGARKSSYPVQPTKPTWPARETGPCLKPFTYVCRYLQRPCCVDTTLGPHTHTVPAGLRFDAAHSFSTLNLTVQSR